MLHKQRWPVGPPDQDFRQNTVYNLYCFISLWHSVSLRWQLLGCCLSHLMTWLSSFQPLLTAGWVCCVVTKRVLHHISLYLISIYRDFKAISAWDIKPTLFTEIVLWPWKLSQGRSLQGMPKIYTRCTWGIIMKTVCVFLPEKFNVHCVTKNSSVTFKTRSRSPMTRFIKAVY